MKHRLTSLAMAVLLVASSISVSAAIEPSMEDFTNYTTENAAPEGWDSVNNAIVIGQPDGYVTVKPTQGAYGKEDSDISLLIESEIDAASLSSAYLGDPFIAKTVELPLDSDGVHLSFEFAYDGSGVNEKYFYQEIKSSRGQIAHGYFLKVTGGNVWVLDRQVAGVTLQPGTWYDFDFYIFPDKSIVAACNGQKLQLAGITPAENGRSYVELKDKVTEVPLDDWSTLGSIRLGSRLFNKDPSGTYALTKTLYDSISYETAGEVPAFAEGWLQRMDNVQKNVAPNGMTYLNRENMENDVFSYTSAAGLGGKKESDTSLLVSNTTGTLPDGAGVASNYYTNPMIQFDASVASGLKQGDVTRITFEIAHKELLVDKYLCLRSGGVDMEGGQVVLRLHNNVAFFGQVLSKRLSAATQKWYQVEILLTTGDETGEVKNKASLYINGEEFAKDVEFSAKNDGTYGQMKDISLMRFGYDIRQHPTEDSAVGTGGGKLNYKEEGVYVDNFGLYVYRDGTCPVGSAVLSSSDPSLQQNLDNISATLALVGSDRDVEEILPTLLAENAAVTMVNAAGEEVSSGPASGNYIKITTDWGTEIYYTITQTAQEIDSEDFSGTIKEATGGAVFSYGANWSGGMDNKIGTTKGVSGLGAKAATDQSLALEVSEETVTAGADPYVYYNYGTVDTTFTVEFSYYLTENNAQFHRIDLGDPKSASTITFAANHEIRLSDLENPVVGSWKEGQWQRVAITVYPKEKQWDVYLNGEQLLDAGALREENALLGQIKFLALYTANEPAYGTFALDDTKVYRGEYSPSAQMPEIVSPYPVDHENAAMLLELDEVDNIYMLIMEDISMGAEGGSYKVYTDESLKQEVGELDPLRTGNILAAVSADGTMLRYYTVYVQDPGASPVILLDGSPAQTIGTGVVSASHCVALEDGEEATLILAKYKEGRLEEVKTVTASGAGVHPLQVQLSNAIEDVGGIRVKAMLWNGIGSLQPVADAAVIQ